MKGSKRKITPNGEGGFRLSLPPRVVQALGLLAGDIVLVDVDGGGVLAKEIRIRKYEPSQDSSRDRPF